MAAQAAGDLGAIAREVIRGHETRYCTDILDAAAQHGELAAGIDPELVQILPVPSSCTNSWSAATAPAWTASPPSWTASCYRPSPPLERLCSSPSTTRRKSPAMPDDYNAKNTKIQHSNAAVTLADEGTHFESLALPAAQTDLWEETALGVVAEAGDYDVLLWAAGYALFGNGKGIWSPGASAEREIQLIVVPKNQRGTMSDNDFVRVGWTPTAR